METSKLKKFAQYARRNLIDEVAKKLQRVLSQESTARRENPRAVTELEKLIANSSEKQVIEKIAYLWFNRFCALRFMDVNRFTRIGVLSPVAGQFQPEILAEAKMGHIDEDSMPEKTRLHIVALLNGTTPSDDPQTEAYRLLIVATCNQYHRAMPYLFERIADYTELLMPDDLLSGNSILAYTREAMTPKVCIEQVDGKDKPIVEVIGWLYQFYIAEKKDAVFADLKKNKKITPENIPAATQLFTPHWIVRYLVENSVGRLWMLNHPDSSLIEKMDYYIKPEQQEVDFLKIQSPEEIKICDPACGSGHMLTYAFDLLYLIYEEQGYEANEIPEKILTHNLYGIEIDERAGELAAFALTMKAREKQRRFFRKPIQPNICILQAIHFDEQELNEYMGFVGRDLFTLGLENTLRQFEEADNFGSLIRPEVTEVANMLETLASKDFTGQLFLGLTHQKVLQVLRQAEYLSPKYQVVVANPPYMGSSGFNQRLKTWCTQQGYIVSRSDIYAAFIQRIKLLLCPNGIVGMVTRQDWVFTKSFLYLREEILANLYITDLALLGKGVFETLSGEVVQPIAFCLVNKKNLNFSGSFINISNVPVTEKPSAITSKAYRFNIPQNTFHNLPLKSFIFWMKESFYSMFNSISTVEDVALCREGIHTGKNEDFLKLWWEIQKKHLVLTADNYASLDSSGVYVPYNKGGTTSKWYGGNEWVIAFSKIYRDEMSKLKGHVRPSESIYFKEGGTWADVASKGLGIRYYPKGFLFDGAGPVVCGDEIKLLIANMNSKPFNLACRTIMPNLHFKCGTIKIMPIAKLELSKKEIVKTLSNKCITLSISDYNNDETSWGFSAPQILKPDAHKSTLKKTYIQIHSYWQKVALEMQCLEEENNDIFIKAYGLQNDLKPKVSLNEITLNCNPQYRYDNDKTDEERDILLLVDTMKELISYAVGCMFGRYSLDKPGLILANQGDTIADYFQQTPESTFPADDDNVIPLLDGDWFTDDISERFFQFLKVTFGGEHYQENLAFIEQALGKDIRKYFLKDFYNDHLKRYKKRPIYWLFSSTKGSFNALIYMHRYRTDTVSVILNDYLREFRTKLSARVDHLQSVEASADASKIEKTKALKEINKLNKMLVEMEEYEREVLYPLATKQIEIDLDDGVKINYGKFGTALKKVTGL